MRLIPIISHARTKLFKPRLATLAIVALGSAVFVGCSSDGGETSTASEKLKVAAAFYPLQEAVERIGGDKVDVTDLTPPGTSPHELELSPKTLADLDSAQIVFYLGYGFQKEVEKAIGSLDDDVVKVNLLEGLPLRSASDPIPGVKGEVDGEVLTTGKDPHAWVDPALFTEMAREIQKDLIEVDPDNADYYETEGAKYISSLEELDESFAGRLENCQSKAVVTSHAAFGYLTDRYGLIQAPIAGISPDDEPDPKSLAATAEFARANGVQVVYFETLVPKDLSETVASEIGARTDALDPVEGLTEEDLDSGKDYASVMTENLNRLEKGLGCSS